MKRVIYTFLVLVLCYSPTYAQEFFPQDLSASPLRGTTAKTHRDNRARFHFQQDTYVGRGQIVGGRPAGCPTRFCACGAAIHLFGKIIPELNLSSNWLRFPRTAAAPNTVAVRRGHVFVLKSHVRGDVWVVHDSNSGGRKTRIHERSIRGYAIVDPRGNSKYAAMM